MTVELSYDDVSTVRRALLAAIADGRANANAYDTHYLIRSSYQRDVVEYTDLYERLRGEDR